MLPYVYVSMKPCRTDKKNIYSINSRNEGDILFEERKFDEALLEYNSAISYALPNSRDLAIAFYKRAVVYLERQKYALSMENIHWARECNLSEIDIEWLKQVLNSMEEKCRSEMMIKAIGEKKFDPWSFFKLSRPANGKIPFIINE